MSAIKTKRPLLKIFLLSLSLILFSYSTSGFYKMSINRNTIRTQVLGSQTSQTSLGLPVRLKIPRLKIDALIENVSLTPEGNMDTPSNTANVGWFALGTRPGEKGSAVIAGHYDDRFGKAGVFADLKLLQTGDKLYIEDDVGKTITFLVREGRIFSPGFADEVFTPNDSPHLNLVTCDGIWDKTAKSYTKRLVVFTDLQEVN